MSFIYIVMLKGVMLKFNTRNYLYEPLTLCIKAETLHKLHFSYSISKVEHLIT
jgi:hypothetical protein